MNLRGIFTYAKTSFEFIICSYVKNYLILCPQASN